MDAEQQRVINQVVVNDAVWREVWRATRPRVFRQKLRAVSSHRIPVASTERAEEDLECFGMAAFFERARRSRRSGMKEIVSSRVACIMYPENEISRPRHTRNWPGACQVMRRPARAFCLYLRLSRSHDDATAACQARRPLLSAALRPARPIYHAEYFRSMIDGASPPHA
eukprot:scaffold13196_cov117-Isochrysis_galbana.AAC.2